MATTEETAAKVEAARKALEEAESDHAAAAASAPPRSFEQIMYSLLSYLSMKFGHHAEISALVTELERRLKLDSGESPAA